MNVLKSSSFSFTENSDAEEEVGKHADVNKEPLELSLLYANQTPEDILLKDRLDALGTRGMNVAYTVDRVPTEMNPKVGVDSEWNL